MLALGSTWLGLLTLVVAAAMALHRPFFADLPVTFVLWLGAPGAMCLGGLVLWAHRKDRSNDAAVAAQRIQAKVGIGMAVVAAAIVYALIIGSEKLDPVSLV